MNIRMLGDAIRRHQSSAFRLQEQMASGRKVNIASDDPGAYEMIRKLSSDRNLLKQYKRNSDMALHYLSNAGHGLYQAVNLFHRVNELAIQGANGTMIASTRKAFAEEVDTLLESLLSKANASEGGRYLYAGLRTDTKPFEAERNSAGLITSVTYQGSEETRTIKTGEGHYVPTNLAGATSGSEGGIFQTETRDLFESLIELRDAFLNNENIAENTAISERLQDDLNHMLNLVALNGAREERVRLHQTYTLEMQVTHLRSLEALESVDIAEMFMRLSESEMAYNAALQTTSNMLQRVSLLNFI